jgi:hypothetical protein
VAGDQPGQGRPRPAAVLASQGRPDRGHADVGAAAPVARQLPEGREPDLAAVGGDPDAVDARPQHHPDPPRPFAAGPEHGEDVVVEQHPAGPAAAGHGRPQGLVVGRQVETGQAPHPDLGQGPFAGLQAGAVAGGRDQLLQGVHGRRHAEVVVGGPGAAGGPEQVAGRVDQGHVGLGVAAVHGQDRRGCRVRKLS